MRNATADSGFSLVELAVVLVIVGVVASYAASGTAAYLASSRQQASQRQVAAANGALILFATRNKRLPCPADGTLPDSAASAGHEALAAPGNTTSCADTPGDRVLPWRDLGLADTNGTDGWGHRISYHVMDGASGLTRPGGMDMSGTRAAATDSTAPSVWLAGKGIKITDGTGNTLLDPADATRGGGAAFVVIAHGGDGAGAYNRDGTLMPPPPAAETSRAADAETAASYVAAEVNDAKPGAPGYFDFIVGYASVHSIAAAAGLGPQ